MKTILFALALTALPAFAGPDFFPGFYGEYRITSWTCESTFKDSGCMDSARIVIEGQNGLSVLRIFNATGSEIRMNELVEKGDAKNSYVLGGDANSATYTVEARDSRGRRYFYNLLEIHREPNGQLRFSQVQESDMAGFKQSLKRLFALEPKRD